MSQTFNYNQKWNEIQTKFEEGKLKSINPDLLFVYNQANKDKNYQQKIKALLNIIQVDITTSDEDVSENIDPLLDSMTKLQTEISKNSGIEKSILQVYLAKFYNQIASETRYKRRNITSTETEQTDFRTWKDDKFYQEITALYEASLKNSEELKKIKTADKQPLISEIDKDKILPTFYDVLFFEYINFLSNNYFSVSDEIKKNQKTEIENLYNEVINYHKNDENKAAYLHFSYNELNYKYSDNFQEKFNRASQLINENLKQAYTSQILYLLATETKNFKNYSSVSKDYKTENTDIKVDAKNNNLIAHNLCLQSINQVPENEYQVNCKNLLMQLEQKTVNIQTDENIYPDQNIPLFIDHKNTNNFTLVIYDVTPSANSQSINTKDIKLQNGFFINNNKKLYKKVEISLKEFSDFNEHSTVYKLDGLPKGTYLLKTVFPGSISSLNGTYIQVSDIFPIILNSINNITEIQLINPNSGEAFKNEKIQIFKRSSKKEGNKTISFYQNIAETQTNNVGIFQAKTKEKSFTDLVLFIPAKKQFISLSGIYNQEKYNKDTKNSQITVQLFTDRAIYRPGQIVYFKGIASYLDDTNKYKIAKNVTFDVILNNATAEEIKTLTLTTNDFGSIFGEFILPNTGLNGTFTIETDNLDEISYRENGKLWNFSDVSGYKSFSVEEYKRPKFQVKIDKPKEEFTLEKEVKINGTAEAFSGSKISNSQVKYRVIREEVYLWKPYSWGRIPYSYNAPEEITNGTTQTDDEGKFSVTFTAKPKNEKKEKEYRSYNYTVYADVTDVNSETHSESTIITIGDLPRKIDLVLKEEYKQTDFKSIKITSENLNGEKTPSVGTIKITKLKEPERILSPNKKKRGDYQLYDFKEFVNYFPHLPYDKNETEPQYYPKGNWVLTENFNTEKSDSIALSSKLERGYYLVEAVTMVGKDSIQTFKFVKITDSNNKTADNNYFTYKFDKDSYSTGDNAVLTFSTDAKDGFVNYVFERNGTKVNLQQLKFENGEIKIPLKISENDSKNGIFFYYNFVKWNDFKSDSFELPIKQEKYDNLKITTTVFRDKISPGKEEKWELNISGKDKDKATAEVLAAMYDASLDQFQNNNFDFDLYLSSPVPKSNIYNLQYNISRYLEELNSTVTSRTNSQYKPLKQKIITFPQLAFSITNNRNQFLNNFKVGRGDYSGINENKVFLESIQLNTPSMKISAASGTPGSSLEMKAAADSSDFNYDRGNVGYVSVGYAISNKMELKFKEDNPKQDLSQLSARTNLKETAFFYPNLYTDKDGNVKLSFTSPEALTQWKLLLFAHTKELQYGNATFYTQTQKELMVVPNAPRFLREGDTVTLSTKIDNISDKKLSGNAQLFLFDGMNNEAVDAIFGNENAQKTFSVDAKKNTEVSWTIKIPKNYESLTYKVVAQAGDFSDGEENILPILTNRMLVTETLPISIKENQNKTFKFDKLLNNKTSNTLQNFNLSLELTTNPTWLAVMSLPYLREYPYECSEQLFSRLYGNMLSTYIINSSPKIKKVFDDWNAKDLTISNLEKNQELKSILLEETPWIRDTENEEEKMKRIAVFFDLNKMKNELSEAQNKLIKRQSVNGGFAWFEGGKENAYITEHIVAGFGKLRNLVDDEDKYINEEISELIKNAIEFIDNSALKEIQQAKKNKTKLSGQNFAHYFYARSFWLDDYEIPSKLTPYLKELMTDYAKNAVNYDLQNQALSATLLQRYDYPKEAQKIVNAIKEKSVESDEMGMYWKSNTPGWFWYQSPIETQAAVIEAVAEVTPNDVSSIEEMKVWLLKNKQTNSWGTTKATTEAVYALMNYGKDWTDSEKGITVKLGSETVYPSKNPTSEQASGYFKQSWKANEIKPEMGEVSVSKSSPGVAWGGVFWQYFEDLDKITSASSDVKMEKQLFIKSNTDKGPVLKEIKDNNSIKIGDLVTVRLVIKTDRDMEYIHLKDMRASGFEPVNVLSSYKWQNSVGYYESTKDASTNFFFDYLPKGIYVFEYEVSANNKGDFSNGITTFQSMYAPEMVAHSEGIRVVIK